MKNKTIACIIARTVSTRLPIKILRDLLPNQSMIEFLIHRLKGIEEIDDIYICTSKDIKDDILEDIAYRNKVKLYRGSEESVIERILDVAEIEDANYVIRITGDNPLTSVEYLPNQIKLAHKHNLDYVRLVNVPIGATAEVINTEALKKCYKEMDPEVSEYLMLFIFDPSKFKCGVIIPFKEDYSNYSITVDTPDDLIRVRNILMYNSNINKSNILLSEVLDILNQELKGLPGKEIKNNGIVKLPYGKTMSFDEFSLDMSNRKLKSMQFISYHE
ncbi:MAG: hypothetical protein M9958_01465 [Chitinophagales bacterium]|nr:hypothetical protein [Chitinophagales bacterium]